MVFPLGNPLGHMGVNLRRGDVRVSEQLLDGPQIGARMLHDVPTLNNVLPYVLHHHEYYDGSGYPKGLAGEQIPVSARIVALADIYDACDLVAYPSLIEGFGNAYLEAVYHRKPVFVNRYPIYDVDIRPKGFRNIEMNGFVTEPLERKRLADFLESLPPMKLAESQAEVEEFLQ